MEAVRFPKLLVRDHMERLSWRVVARKHRGKHPPFLSQYRLWNHYTLHILAMTSDTHISSPRFSYMRHITLWPLHDRHHAPFHKCLPFPRPERNTFGTHISPLKSPDPNFTSPVGSGLTTCSSGANSSLILTRFSFSFKARSSGSVFSSKPPLLPLA